MFSAANGYAPAALVTGNGLNSPSGVAIDANADMLYASNVATNSISAFRLVPNAGSATGFTYQRFVQFTNLGLVLPQGLAIAANGTLYVANANNSVSVLAPRNLASGNIVQPSITGGGLDVPTGAAVDATGKLYVANLYGNSVSVFDTAHGNAFVTSISGGGLNQPVGITAH